MKFAFIKEQLTDYPLGLTCRVLEVSRAGYYAWRKRPLSVRAQRREALAVKVQAVHEANRRVYGSPRGHQALQAQGEKVCANTVAQAMKERQIWARTKRKFVPRTTDSRHSQPVAPNVLDRQFKAPRPNAKWAVDLTYIPTDEGGLYLAGVIDLCSRRIVGWSMADHMKIELVRDALQMALVHRRPAEGLLHHSPGAPGCSMPAKTTNSCSVGSRCSRA